MRTMLEIMDAYRKGDRLSPEEWQALHERMEAIAHSTIDLGDLFALTSSYASRLASDTRGILKAIAENAERERQRQRTVALEQEKNKRWAVAYGSAYVSPFETKDAAMDWAQKYCTRCAYTIEEYDPGGAHVVH